MVTRPPLRSRRWLAALALLVVLLPAPAGAQTRPTISLNPDWAQAGAGGSWTIQVSGSGFYPNRSDGRISFGGDATTYPFTTNASGSFGPVTITPARRGAGSLAVVAAQPNACAPRAVCSASASRTFYVIDASGTDEGTGRTDCAPAGAAWVLRVVGRGWEPGNYAYFDFLRDGEVVASQSRILVQTDGTFSGKASIPAQPDGPTYTIHVYDLAKRDLTIPWAIPCPTRPSTTTTSTAPTTTTTRPGTTTTVAGVVTLTVEPPLGPPGFVPQVRGGGWPPGPVLVRWQGGVGQTTATAAADGTFVVPLIVLPGDRLGNRAVVATAGPVERFAPFLVVPDTVKPSGRDVAQISRARRYLQR